VYIKQTKDGHPLPSTGSYTIENLQKQTHFYLIVTLTVPGQDKPLITDRYCPVDVTLSKPEINLFEGKLDYSPGGMTLILNWDTSINTDHCTLTGKDSFLKPSSTDDSCQIKLKDAKWLNKTYKLTAVNKAGTDTSEIVLHYEAKLLNSVKGANLKQIAVSPDNTRLYVTHSGDAWLTFWILDARTLQFISGHNPYGALVADIAVSPDSKRLYMNSSGTVGVIDAQTLKKIAYRSVLNPTSDLYVRGVAVSTDGTRLYVPVNLTASESTQFLIMDAQTLETIGESGLTKGYSQGIAVSPDNTRIYLLMAQSVLGFDAQTLNPIVAPLLEGDLARWWPSAFAVSPANNRLYVASPTGPTLWGFTTDSLRLVEPAISIDVSGDDSPDHKVYGLAIAHDNSCIYMTNAGRVGKYSSGFITGGKARA
jgi:hypothetical protein